MTQSEITFAVINALAIIAGPIVAVLIARYLQRKDHNHDRGIAKEQNEWQIKFELFRTLLEASGLSTLKFEVD